MKDEDVQKYLKAEREFAENFRNELALITIERELKTDGPKNLEKQIILASDKVQSLLVDISTGRIKKKPVESLIAEKDRLEDEASYFNSKYSKHPNFSKYLDLVYDVLEGLSLEIASRGEE